MFKVSLFLARTQSKEKPWLRKIPFHFSDLKCQLLLTMIRLEVSFEVDREGPEHTNHMLRSAFFQRNSNNSTS